jgi:3-isopropylmalate dehydrogenase
MKTYQIAVLPGDGIGPEVTREAVGALQEVSAGWEHARLSFREHSVGAAEFLRSGTPLPEEAFAACRAADAVLLGAMGLPDVRWPDGKEMTPQIDLRERLDLYCGLRPIYLYHGDDSPLRGRAAGDIDLLIVRENTEGLFSGRLSTRDPQADEVRDVLRVSRTGSERLLRAAFRQAGRRRKKLSLIDKANVLPSMVFLREIFDQIAEEFPGIETERIYVDAAALYLVQQPERFDVLVTENIFGDILSDLAAGLIGGMGMAPSADIGDHCAVFQPAHGTAPDIAGQDKANPTAMILSAAMLLEWLDAPETVAGAHRIRLAVHRVLETTRDRTADLGGTMTTSQMGRRVRDCLGQLP